MDRMWMEFLNGTLCGLCGNLGEIDTRETAIDPTGVRVGGLHWCVCPNGRALARQYRKGNAQHSDGTRAGRPADSRGEV